jgi:hypothetical protein
LEKTLAHLTTEAQIKDDNTMSKKSRSTPLRVSAPPREPDPAHQPLDAPHLTTDAQIK